jgi:toxin ParE1/3/4
VTKRRIVRRALADQDVRDAIAWYVREGGAALGERFIVALERAAAHLARSPSAGSPRYAHELGIEGLRVWPLRGFPYRIVYRDTGALLDVWRVLHAQRDIPAWLRG